MASLPPNPNPTLLKEPTPPLPSQANEAPLLEAPAPSEPAEKWAERTLGAVSGEQDRIHDLPASNVSTPGPVVPGAYPLPVGTGGIQNPGAAVSSALQTVGGYMGAAGQKVAEYVPPSVSRIIPSLSNKSPSPEHPELSKNGLSAVSGESLAKLPDERKEEGTLTARGNERNANGLETLSGESFAKLPEERAQQSALPSVTEQALNTGASALSTAQGYAAGAAQAVQNVTAPAAQAAQGATTSTIDSSKDTATHARDMAIDTRDSYTKAASTTAQNIAESTSNTARSADTTARDYANSASNTVSNATNTTVDTTKDYTNSAGSAVSNTAGAAAQTTRDASFAAGGAVASVVPEPVKGGTVTAFDTAREYVQTAGDKAKAYLPESIASHGTPQVATRDDTVLNANNANGLTNLPDDSTSVAVLPEERNTAMLPSHDHESTTPLGKSDGVGRLPEGRGVAVLPDEKKNQSAFEDHHEKDQAKSSGTTAVKPFSAANILPLPTDTSGGASHDASIRTLAGSLEGKNEKFAPGIDLSKKGEQTLDGKERHEGLGEQSPPAVPEKPHFKSSQDGSTTAHTGHTPTVNTQGREIGKTGTEGVHVRDTSAGSVDSTTSSSSSQKKTGFMTKVKGEMKVLSGKLTHKEEKVLEGKKLLGKN